MNTNKSVETPMQTNPTLQERIEALKKLNSERTPGEWIAGCHPANDRLNIVKPIMFGKYVGKLPECEGGAIFFLHKSNAEFIASAPEMAAIITELCERLVVTREALQWAEPQVSLAGIRPNSAFQQALAATDLAKPWKPPHA